MWNNTTVPNPDTYLNHLQPDQAAQFEVVRNFGIAAVGAAVWDVLVYIPEDIKIVRRCAGLVTTGCFIFSRVFAITYLMLWVIVATHSISDCNAIRIAMQGFLCSFSMATTSFLFLRRVQAVYTGNRFVYWLAWFLWAGTSGASATLASGVRLFHIPGTRYCMVYEMASYVPWTTIMPTIFDTLVFFTISYKLAATHNDIHGTGITRDTFIFGKTLPRLQRAMLQEGQQYYLITFLFNGILVNIFLFSPTIPLLYRTMFAIPGLVLAASMACRVHRHLAKAFDDGHVADVTVSDLRFASGLRHPKTTTIHSLYRGQSEGMNRTHVGEC